jgi:hypothetical protein
MCPMQLSARGLAIVTISQEDVRDFQMESR